MQNPKSSDPLLDKAKSMSNVHPAYSRCWGMVRRGIGAGMLESKDLGPLIADLSGGKDCIFEELAFELVDGRLRVSLMDAQDDCDPGEFIALLKQLKTA